MNLLKTKGSIYLISVLVITSIGVFMIDYFFLDRNYYRYTVIIPGVLAILFLFFSKLSDLSYAQFFKQFKVTYEVVGWLLLALIIYTLLSYIASLISALIFNGNFVIIPDFKIPLSKIWLIFVLAFFEEIGWRGFGLPHFIKRSNFITSSLAVGVVWALWHFPGYLVGFGAPSDVPLLLFLLWVLASSFIFTWLYLKSNANLWTAILLHFGANMALQLYPIMPSPAGTSATFYIMTVLVVVIAIVLSIKYLELIKTTEYNSALTQEK